jgi:hypothetical protein
VRCAWVGTIASPSRRQHPASAAREANTIASIMTDPRLAAQLPTCHFLGTGYQITISSSPASGGRIKARRGEWWATKDLNLGPLPCEGSALTTELVAQI